MQIYSWPIFLFALSVCFVPCAFPLAVYISSSPLIRINNIKNCNLLISHNSLDYLLSEGRWQWGWEFVAFPPHPVLVGELLMVCCFSSAGRADRGQATTAERIKSWHGEGRNSNKPAGTWQFLEATSSHFAVKASHHGGHFVRSNGRASDHLVLAERKKINIARGGGWLGAPELLFH